MKHLRFGQTEYCILVLSVSPTAQHHCSKLATNRAVHQNKSETLTGVLHRQADIVIKSSKQHQSGCMRISTLFKNQHNDYRVAGKLEGLHMPLLLGLLSKRPNSNEFSVHAYIPVYSTNCTMEPRGKASLELEQMEANSRCCHVLHINKACLVCRCNTAWQQANKPQESIKLLACNFQLKIFRPATFS